jgi:hypothetical protein
LDTTHFAHLLRSLATTPSRRSVTRALAGFALAGPPNPLFGLTETDAKRRKKKRHRKKKRRKKNPPFCAGKDACIDPAALCGSGVGEFPTDCFCHTTTSGTPFCADVRSGDDCSQCAEGEACIVKCNGGVECASPCPNPF